MKLKRTFDITRGDAEGRDAAKDDEMEVQHKTIVSILWDLES